MTTPPRKPLYYTFGNHMHWVDMQWLWGYEVLPGSVRDMLHLCRETGAKGCVNFDAIGYEKMAAECPEALAELRDAVQAGTIEPVGCSYGQPYGLFQGGESNIRQFTYGVRSTRRLLGVRPRTFWEEEFYFFPQLPQILTSCGYTGANLFFQWTWHTPEVPKEPASLILWEGADATRIPTLPRNALNVHQWPEDFDGLLDQGLINDLDHPAIVQWLELMPSKDWMCRSEVLLPRLKELFADPRFELRPRTCAELITELMAAKAEPEAQARVQSPTTTPDPSPPAAIPIRAYTMDQVWHGMTLGKNADRHPRRSREVEQAILAAESLSALAGLFGRPYASWDVYPTWELDEAWRELLAAQHHDNHECEGLCGFVGYHQIDKADALAVEVLDRTEEHIARRIAVDDDREIITNTLGWPISVSLNSPDGRAAVVTGIPPFGHAPLDPDARSYRLCSPHEIEERGTDIVLRGSGCWLRFDATRCAIAEMMLEGLRTGSPGQPAAECRLGTELASSRQARWRLARGEDGDPEIVVERHWRELRVIERIGLLAHRPGARISIDAEGCDALEPGYGGGLRLALARAQRDDSILADAPSSIDQLRPQASCRRKYPIGDWMTSEQWFETVERPFTANRFCEFAVDVGRLLLLVDAPSQGFLLPDSAELVVAVRDPWDESRCESEASRTYFLLPGDGLTNADRVRVAEETARFLRLSSAIGDAGDIPATWGSLSVEGAPGVLAHAFFRDSPKSGEHLPDWAGHRFARESDGLCTHPYAVRLVEWNAEPAEVVLKLPGPIASAAKTNCMGECGDWPIGRAPADAPAHLRDTGWLTTEPATPPDWAEGAALDGRPIPWSQLRFPMRSREIATVMADLVMGRKQFRDLDAKREVWATVHRTGGEAN